MRKRKLVGGFEPLLVQQLAYPFRINANLLPTRLAKIRQFGLLSLFIRDILNLCCTSIPNNTSRYQ